MHFSFETFDFSNTAVDADKPAIIGEDGRLSWQQFETSVNDLIQFLTANNLDKLAHPVVIYGHKEVELIVAIYSCMKLGITYIPIDVIYPKERLEKVITAAKVTCILNCSEQQLSIDNLTEIAYNKGIATFLTKKDGHIFQSILPVDPIVYMIFTSGSTGEPKGVQITRAAVRSFVHWMTHDFGFTSQDIFINTALFSFDLSVFELMTFGALGGGLLLNSKQLCEQPDAFLERLHTEKGSVMVATPSFVLKYARLENAPIIDTLKYFLFCGEVLPHTTAQALLENYPNTKVINTYGPTEATVATTIVEITPSILEKYNPLPVGFPKRESTLTIEEDEIVIVGENVSIGYVNRPDLNETKFFKRNEVRGFRTGDLGYFQDGMLFCKGRNDDQIKLHGYRIELNEITAKLNELPHIAIAETIALRRNEEVKKVVSLIVLAPGNTQDAATIKQQTTRQLQANLPDYMVPSDIKIIEEMPLNQNGKADKKQLELMYLGKL